MRPITDRTNDEERPVLAGADDRSGATASPLAPGDRRDASHERSPLGRFVMPRDGRRVVALVTRMRDRSHVTIVARHAIVATGVLRFAIVERGQS